MLRYLLSSRAILAGVVFFVVVVGGSLLYSRHVRRTIDAELTRTDALLQQLKEKNETPTENQAVHISTETETPGDDAEHLDVADAFLPDDFVSEEEPAEEVPVSPFGFGPYPEVPEGYLGTVPWHWSEEFIAKLEKALGEGLKLRGISFTEHLKISELMARVGIKLLNEGRSCSGMTSSDQTGLFYPGEPDVLYVKWREVTDPNGEVRRYMSSTIGTAISGLSIAARQGREPLPDWIEIRSLEDGIDPYEFLGLNR